MQASRPPARSLRSRSRCSHLTGSEAWRRAQAAEVLAPAFVNGRRVDLAGLGHMGPVTHPDLVNREVEAFLASRAQTGGVSPEEAVR